LASSDIGEFELISRFFSRRGVPIRTASGVVLGIGDDAAVLEVPAGAQLVVAVDTIVAGRHFLDGSDARAIGHRALAVNLSDLAAMGASPKWATLALTLPAADAAWLERFSSGLLDLADANGIALVGGDTTRGPLTVSVQIMGHVPKGTALCRSGARPGDLLVVSGTLGDAGAGLAILTAPGAAQRSSEADFLVRRFDYPIPRVQLGLVARGVANAAMDISDGLSGDLPKLAQASGVAAHVDVERLPLSAAMRAVAGEEQSRDWALSAGDDYELLLAVPRERYAALKLQADRLNLTLTVIGELRDGTGVTWSLNGKDFVPKASGYDHFGRATTQITV
jgi:thiamine-monophosphate kinase